jgi:hypothetical protein
VRREETKAVFSHPELSEVRGHRRTPTALAEVSENCSLERHTRLAREPDSETGPVGAAALEAFFDEIAAVPTVAAPRR